MMFTMGELGEKNGETFFHVFYFSSFQCKAYQHAEPVFYSHPSDDFETLQTSLNQLVSLFGRNDDYILKERELVLLLYKVLSVFKTD